MTESAESTHIQSLSTSLASLIARTAPSVTAVQSHRSRSSGSATISIVVMSTRYTTARRARRSALFGEGRRLSSPPRHGNR
jgi:hypothetical protein